MVDVGGKPLSRRRAVARATVRDGGRRRSRGSASCRRGTRSTTAQLAGIMAAKRTSELIPLCHPLPLTAIDVRLAIVRRGRRDRGRRRDDRPDRCRDGGADGGDRRGADRLRHGQGDRQGRCRSRTCGWWRRRRSPCEGGRADGLRRRPPRHARGPQRRHARGAPRRGGLRGRAADRARRAPTRSPPRSPTSPRRARSC